MESARLARLDDLPAIEAIAAAQRDAISDERGGALLLRREAGGEPVDGRARRLVEGVDGAAVAGCYDDVVFGYGLVEWERLPDGGRLARITDLVVEAGIRGSGIGEAMMNLLVELAEAAGCLGIDALALPGDRETKNFFESFGLKARLLTVHRALGAAGDAG